MKKWKALLAAASAALVCGAVLAGCGSDTSERLAPKPPKEAVARLKFADREVPLYEYTGAVIPALEGKNANLAVTKDAIYGIRSDAE